MGKDALRKDKTCLNCRYVVENRYCPNCGQENTDTRKTFYHLFVHFFEDLTHYENAFWKTIRNLILKPATLTKEYLSGKRLSYLAPVRLYIFISFVTFLTIAIFPGKDALEIKTSPPEPVTKTANDSLKKGNIAEKEMTFDYGYKSVQELDSIQKYSPEDKKLNDFNYWISRKFQVVKDNNTDKEIIEKFIESFIHNLPKVLFIFMPFFAFFLWLLHSKKRWYYFDHGIFTLHYFSFLLLLFLILFLINKIETFFEESNFIGFITIVCNFVGISWMMYYFYPAHHRFYGETRVISFIKSILLLILNIILFIIIMTLYAIYTFINLH